MRKETFKIQKPNGTKQYLYQTWIPERRSTLRHSIH